MKYTSEQMIQALKDGKSFCFYHISDSNLLYKATLVNGVIIVEWGGQQTAYPFSNGKPVCVDSWVCTKIEGEETVMNKPHKHAELIKKWADGAIIQYGTIHGEWIDCKDNKPYWSDINEYRVKPTLVKKWKWVYESPEGVMLVTCARYSSSEEFYNLNPYNGGKILQKVDSTMQEVEEQSVKV